MTLVNPDPAVSSSTDLTARRLLIGVLGGMGPAATADFYTKLVASTPAQRDQDHLRAVIWSDPTIPDRTAALLGRGLDPTPHLVAGARRLTSFGAEVIAMPCNTAHAFLPAIQRAIDIPVVSMIEAAVDAILKAHPSSACVGLLATTGTVVSGIYRDALDAASIPMVAPDDRQQLIVMDAISAIKAGDINESTAQRLATVTEQLANRGANILLAGCSEVLLVFSADKTSLEVVDPVQALVGRLLRMMGIVPLTDVGGGR